MNYVILHKKRSGFLNSYHGNGGFELKDVFPFSITCWTSFKSRKEATDYLDYIKRDSLKQAKRWGNWSEIAQTFIKGLYVGKIELNYQLK